MDSSQLKQAKAIFILALEKDAAQRRAFLDDKCRDDPAVRAEVESLLAAAERAGERLDSPTVGTVMPRGVTIESNGNSAGSSIGPYKLLQLIGEGGFGSVFMAEQDKPVRRRVALKIIKLGMDTKQVIARFEAERQALAMMDHPNIAKILDAGATDAGRPYFVMELVRGVPITDYCDGNKLSVPERLELYVKVCEAVQHAHQKGIIHRDIKPSNVMVAMIDGRPTPKVIDFGIAKATDQRLTEKTIFTEFRQMIGTPQYMSPEQAEMAGIDIDTRSDVYSLGVLLYELLVGSTPFDPKELRSKAYGEIQRMIREVEPPRPSTRLSTLNDTIKTIAAHRRIEPVKLGQILRGELDWVVMRAMEKDRMRRYETANGLAADVRRYLAGEAVLAAPPGKTYRLKKFVRRHRGPVAAAALLLLTLMLGVAGTTIGLIRARSASQAEATRAAGERQARLIADQARETAEKRLAQIKKGNEILGSVFKDLNPDRDSADGKPLRALLGDRLDQATRQLEAEAVGDPLAVAELQLTLGESQMGLGFPDRAIPLFAAARDTNAAHFGPGDRRTLIALNDLATAYETVGSFEKALPLHEESLRLTRANPTAEPSDLAIVTINLAADYEAQNRMDLALPLFELAYTTSISKLGPRNPATLLAVGHLAHACSQTGKAERARLLLEEAIPVSKAVLGPDHLRTLNLMGSLADMYGIAGRNELALSLAKEAFERSKAKLGSEHPQTLTLMISLADAYSQNGRLDLALPLAEESYTIASERLGPDDPTVIRKLNALSQLQLKAGKIDRALSLLMPAEKRTRGKLGPEHPLTLLLSSSLAIAYHDNGQTDLAIPLFIETLKIRTAHLGASHPDTLASANNLAMAYQAVGQTDLAIQLQEESVRVRKAALGPENPATLAAMINLSELYERAGKHDLALPIAEQVYKTTTATLDKNNPETLDAMNNLGKVRLGVAKVDESIALFEQALPLARATLGDDNPRTLLVMGNLGNAYRAGRHFDKAIPLLEQALKSQQATLPPAHPDTLLTMNNLVVAYQEAGKADKSLPLCEEAYKLVTAKLGPSHPSTVALKSNLGINYLAVGRFDAAIPLLEQTLNSKGPTPASDPAGRLRIMNYLVIAYRAAGRADEALPWLDQIVDQSKATLGPEHPETIAAMVQRSWGYWTAGKTERALPLMEETAKLAEKLGPDSAATAAATNNLAVAYMKLGRHAQSLPLLTESLARSKANLGPDHPQTLATMNNLAMEYLYADKPELALPVEQEAMKLSKAALGEDHPLSLRIQASLGAIFTALHRQDDAIRLLEEVIHRHPTLPKELAWIPGQLADAYEGAGLYDKEEPLLVSELADVRKRFGSDNLETARTLSLLTRNLLLQKKFAGAESPCREALAVREKHDPDGWATANSRSMLGQSLLGQKKYTDAEPLLLAGYQGMKLREASIPPAGRPRLNEAVGGLVQLYDATGKPDEAARWRKELEAGESLGAPAAATTKPSVRSTVP